MGTFGETEARSPTYRLLRKSYMAAINLTVALAHRVMTGLWPRFGDERLGM
jgi:hypothetical protein